MAITTRNKRAACLGIALPFRVWPNPDGSIAALADRQQDAFLYPGILAHSGGSPQPPVFLGTINDQMIQYLDFLDYTSGGDFPTDLKYWLDEADEDPSVTQRYRNLIDQASAQ